MVDKRLAVGGYENFAQLLRNFIEKYNAVSPTHAINTMINNLSYFQLAAMMSGQTPILSVDRKKSICEACTQQVDAMGNSHETAKFVTDDL